MALVFLLCVFVDEVSVPWCTGHNTFKVDVMGAVVVMLNWPLNPLDAMTV